MSAWKQEEKETLPSLARLQETRLQRWHQTGEALLTLENLRSWMNASGLVLFAPRPQIVAPAPTMVEAVLGAANMNPTAEQTAEARGLLGRLVAEGIAIPLSLLGSPSGAVGETPDYVASAGVFSYIFTLRGDKLWKQAPQTTGAAKVSQLAANTYESLVQLGAKSAYDLARELGNEVTEAAVLRALGELWTHLRVLPLSQPDGKPTLWELTGTRFTKQVKAGANAGQPSALSALISLYLGQVSVATEDEIEVFLSPLAPRSRIRDVVHALTAARELESLAIEGRTMLRLAGETADFLPESVTTEQPAEATAAEADAEPGSLGEEAGPTEPVARITKFVPKPRKVGTGYLAKGRPVKTAGRSFASGSAAAFKPRAGEGLGERAGAERERRPFKKRADGGGITKPGEATEGATTQRFDRPWGEDRPKRTAAAGPRPVFSRAEFADRRPPREGGPSDRRAPRRDGGKEGGWKPAARTGPRPARPAPGGPDSAPRRGDREGAAPRGGSSFAAGADRSARPKGVRPGGFGDRPGRPGGFAKRPGGPRPEGYRGAGAGDRPFRSRTESGAAGDRPERPFRRFDAPRAPGKRPFAPRTGDSPRRERPGDDRPRNTRPREDHSRDDRPKREFRPREEAPAGAREGRGGKFSPRPQGSPTRGTGGAFGGKRGGPGADSPGRRHEGSSTARPGGFTARPQTRGGFSRRPSADRAPSSGGAGGFSKQDTAPSERPPRRKFKPKGDQPA